MNWQALIVIGLIILGIVFLLNFPVYTEVEEERSDKEIEQVISMRANTVQNVVDALCDAWNLREGDFDPKAEMLPTGTTLVTAIYQRSLIRFYLNWKRNKIRICITIKYADKSRIYTKLFRLKEKQVFEKVYAFFEKYNPASEQQPATSQDKIEKLADILETIIEQKVRLIIEEKLAECEDTEPSEKDHAQ